MLLSRSLWKEGVDGGPRALGKGDGVELLFLPPSSLIFLFPRPEPIFSSNIYSRLVNPASVVFVSPYVFLFLPKCFSFSIWHKAIPT